MKIVHLCLASFYRKGYSYQENLLPKYHSRQGNEVFVIASCEEIDDKTKGLKYVEPERFYCEGYSVKRIPYIYGKLGTKLRLYENLYEELKYINPDIIFIHGVQFLDIFSVKKYKLNNSHVKIYIDNHADFINSGKNFISKYILHKKIWKFCAKSIEPYVDKFYGVLPNRCEFLTDVYNINSEKIELLVMGVDDDNLRLKDKDSIKENVRKKLGIEKSDFVIVTGGKINKSKNIHILAEAINKLNIVEVKLIIFGEEDSEMKIILEGLKLNNKIIKIGWIDSKEVYSYFLASDLGVFPGTHSVLWEQAVGSGLPCIFKEWDGMQHVDVGGNCIFIKDINAENIKNKIELIYKDKKLYENMKSIANQCAIKKFSYSNIAKCSIKSEDSLYEL